MAHRALAQARILGSWVKLTQREDPAELRIPTTMTCQSQGLQQLL